MNKRQEIKALFRNYVEALEQNDLQKMGECFDENIILESSNYGCGKGKAQVMERLSWKGMAYNYAKYKIFNFVCFAAEKEARSSCVVTALLGQETADYFHYFQFGGYYVAEYVYNGREFKISALRFHLDMEDGNTLFVRDWWKMIDYRRYQGTEKPVICPELDSPWSLYPMTDDHGSEAEQVKDALFRYAWGIDQNDFVLFETMLCDQVHMVTGKGENAVSGLDALQDIMTKEQVIRFMKYKRFKEPVMEHIYKIVSVKIEGNTARIEAWRYEPHRLGTAKLHKYNKEQDFYSGSFFYDFVKEPGAFPNGGWKMKTNGVRFLKTFCEELPERKWFYSDED